MKLLNILVLVCCLVTIILCGSSCNHNPANFEGGNASSLYGVSNVRENAPPPPPGSSAPVQNDYNPKLIKKGELTISSNAIETTKTLLYSFVKACNGNVISENLVKSNFSTYYEIGLNVRASDFDKFLNLLDSAELNIVSRSFTVEDITLQYTDDSTRLQNKKKLRDKYLGLLVKATDMKSTLDIEDKIEELQTDIELKEGRMKLLDKQVAYSDFSVRIELDDQNLSDGARNKFTYRIGKGISNGWHGMKEFVIFLVTIWPVYLFAGVFLYLIRYIIRRRRKNKK